MALAGLIVIAMTLLVIAPTLVSWGLGQGMVRGAIQRRVNGSVAMKQLALGWFGPQEINGLRVSGDDGHTTVTVNVRVNAGLFDLLRGVDRVEVDADGAMLGTLREDGSTSLESLLASSTDDDAAGAVVAAAQGPPSLAGLPAVLVRLNGIDLTLVDDATQQTVGIKELNGELSYDRGEIKVDLHGASTGGARPGTVKVLGGVHGLTDADGVLTPARASGQLDVQATNLRVLLADRPTELSSVTLSLHTDDPTGRIELDFRADAVIDGRESGHLTGSLVADGLLNADGTFNAPLDRITGELEGESVPTALLQRFLTPIVATRDLGPTFSVDARFGAGESREISVDARSEHVQIDFVCRANPEQRSLRGERLLVNVQVQPALLAQLTSLHAAGPIQMMLSVDELVVRPADVGVLKQLADATVTGRVAIASMPALRLQPEGMPLPQIGPVLLEFVAPRLGAETIISGETTIDGAPATVHLSVDRLITADGEIAGDRMSVSGRLDARVTPELVASLQQAAEQPIVLAHATEVSVVLEPVEVPLGEIRGHVERFRATLEHVPGLAAPITIDASLDNLALRLGDMPTFMLAGEATLGDRDQAFARTRFDLEATRTEAGIRFDQLNAEAHELDVARLDRMLGQPAGMPMAEWLGPTGSVTVLAGRDEGRGRVEIGAEFPQLHGDFVAIADEKHITITGSDLTTIVRRQTLDQRMSGVTVEADVPLSLNLNSLRIPRALALGEPLDSTEVDVDITFTGGPVVLIEPDLGRNTIERVQITLSGRDLAEGLALTVDGDIRFEQSAEPGELTLEGRVLDLLDEQKKLNTSNAQLVLDSTFRGLPTPLVDAIMGLEGLLTATVGPRMNLRVSARNFSRNGGQLDARIDTSNGWLEGRIRGRNDGLLIREDEGLRAELEVTSPLRERLLKKINPLLADIRTTEQPIRAQLGRTIVPLDGNLTRLQSDIDVTVGAVEFDSGSIMLSLLKVSRPETAASFPGYIEPIKATIRKGVVRYETFKVRVDKYTMSFSGVVDLNTRAVDLRTEVPLEGLAGTFRELDGLTDDLVVPLVTRGTLDNYRTEIEPEFLAEAAAQIGIRKGLDELEKETGVPIGDIFEGLFGKKKKK